MLSTDGPLFGVAPTQTPARTTSFTADVHLLHGRSTYRGDKQAAGAAAEARSKARSKGTEQRHGSVLRGKGSS